MSLAAVRVPWRVPTRSVNQIGRLSTQTAVLRNRSFATTAAARRHQIAAALTVNLSPSGGSRAELQQTAVDCVTECLGQREAGTVTRDHDAAVVLVSRSLAIWLEDDVFVSRLLAATGMTQDSAEELSVLTAAVDEVPLYDRRLDFFGSSEGISVLRGSASRVLPTLWDSAAPSHSSQPATLRFQLPQTQLLTDPSAVVPLTNTVFSTGRQHGLYASRWQAHPAQNPRLIEKRELSRQTIVFHKETLDIATHSVGTVAAHLVPVTSPRKVVHSLGNILSQVEIDGKPFPASQELEAVVPPLYEQRVKNGKDHAASGPMGVWALTIPKHVFEDAGTHLSPLQLKDYHLSAELDLARTTAEKINTLISSGCQLHKVLSGGGGWGQKRGLLSLDPRTQCETDEHEDLQSFMDSFRGQAASGIASPGTYVQFLVEAAYPTEEPEGSSLGSSRRWDLTEHADAVTTVFGTAGVVPLDGVRSSPGLFGAVSSEGVYLSGKTSGKGESEVATKMDTPRSYIIHQSKTKA